jgi:hypothetical protein
MGTPAPGTALGAYRVDGVIGAGSMGDVFRGVDVGLSRKVAIKILSEKHKDSNELRARFTREGRAVAAIAHPNVVQVFATGMYEDRPYIAMELLEGTDLATLVDDDGPMTSVVAARALLDAARGLDAAAKAGLIHRDVKPSNLVRLNEGKVKVTDFGLAKPVDPGSEPALTALGVVVGTPDYIAPEQARGEKIDERVDIYALGGTLYFLVTGLPPFRTGNPAEDKYLKVVARHLKNPPPDARERAPGVDAELAELARAMMAKKPAERPDYPTLIARLEAIVQRLQDGRAATVPPASPGASRSDTKTPFVGADAPPAFTDDVGSTRAAIAAVGAQRIPTLGVGGHRAGGDRVRGWARPFPRSRRRVRRWRGRGLGGRGGRRRRAGGDRRPAAAAAADPARGHGAGAEGRRHAVVLRRRAAGHRRRVGQGLPQAQGAQGRGARQARRERALQLREGLRADGRQAL